jgi:hypothetical protein
MTAREDTLAEKATDRSTREVDLDDQLPINEMYQAAEQEEKTQRAIQQAMKSIERKTGRPSSRGSFHKAENK